MSTSFDWLPDLPPIPSWVPDVVSAIAIVLALVAVFLLARGARSLARKAKTRENKPSGADLLTWLAASIATAVSASGMWQFFERIMPDVPWYWRVAMFAFIEVAVINSAVRAKRSMREKYSAGVDGIAVWALTSLSAVLSAMEAASFPEGVFRLAAPLVAAWLWERGMAIERHRATGRGRINWRITPERFLVWFGLAEAQDRTASEVDVQRRLTRVALAADNVADAKPGSWRQRRHIARLKKRGRQMVEHTAVAQDTTQQELLMAQLGVARSIAALAEAAPTPFWKTEDKPSDFARLADETQRLNEGLAARHDRDSLANLAMLAAMATGHHLVPVTPGATVSVTHAEVASTVTKEVTDPPFFPPREWLDEAAGVTPGVTPDVTVERVTPEVTDKVTIDVTDPSAYDTMRALSGDLSVTGFVIPGVTRPAITEHVTPEVTPEPDPEPDPQPKTSIMREHWDKVRDEEKRYPPVAELAEVSDAHHSLASRKRAEWVKELSYWERKKANPEKAINGSKPSS